MDYSQRYWEDVVEGEALPHVEDEITYRRVAMTPGATLDHFPGHHDPAYARSLGRPTIFVNTMHFLAFVDRMATDWGGPRTFVTRRTVTLRLPIHAGDTMVGDGRVVRRYVEPGEGRERHLVELDIKVCNQRGELCGPATVQVELPTRSSS